MDHEWIKKIPRDQLERMYFKEREENMKNKNSLRWIHQFMSNTTASGDEIKAAYWLHFRMKVLKPREDGLFHVHNSDIVKHSGLSDDKLGKILKKFKDRGIIDREVERRSDKDTGEIKTESWLAFDQSILENPRVVDFGKNTKHGGVREKGTGNACGCGCSEKVVRRKVICAGCGAVLEETEKHVGESEDLNLDSDEEVF